MIKKMTALSLAILTVLFSAACGSNGSSGPTFYVYTEAFVNGTNQREGNVNFEGFDIGGGGYTPWDTHVGPHASDSTGYRQETNVDVPNQWSFTRYPSPLCNTVRNKGGWVGASQVIHLTCSDSILLFNTDPSSMDAYSHPDFFTITGQSISQAYGSPRIQFYNEMGNVFATTYASAVAGDGSWVQTPTPDLSVVYSGTYDVLVANQNPDGSYTAVGATTLEVTGNDYQAPDPCTINRTYC
jgi:hypothetical protein